MAIITREQFLAVADCEPRIFESKVWGGEFKYRPMRLNDKTVCRRQATVPNRAGKDEVDNERLEAAIILRCTLEPKLEPGDMDFLLERNSAEVSRYAKAIMNGGEDVSNPR